jgi:hypothetical protein
VKDRIIACGGSPRVKLIAWEPNDEQAEPVLCTFADGCNRGQSRISFWNHRPMQLSGMEAKLGHVVSLAEFQALATAPRGRHAREQTAAALKSRLKKLEEASRVQHDFASA